MAIDRSKQEWPEDVTLNLDALVEQARDYGTRAAKALHRNHDRGLCSQMQKYQRGLEYQHESVRGALANAYREAYTEESSYYIGQHCTY